ncbi:EH domain-containing protein 4 [Grus japonensis]|uniref:EH domain-containing protein 4 n=1 Tax=Grus japonensis TaxID=30415 RepID=A0ABC9WS72_GRUJA
MPAGSKMDLPLAKAKPKPISDGGSASGITKLRRGKKNHQEQLKPETRVRICERNSPAATKVSAEGGGGDAPGARAEIPLQPVEKTMVRQAVHLQPMEDDGEQISTCSLWRTPCQSRWRHLKEAVTLWVSPCWSRLLAGPLAPWRQDTMLEQVCWQDLWPHGGPTLEQSGPEGLHPMEGTHTGAVCEGL